MMFRTTTLLGLLLLVLTCPALASRTALQAQQPVAKPVVPEIPAEQAYREVIQWASQQSSTAVQDELLAKIERSAYRYGILPEFALAVVAAEARYGNGISFARQDSWRLYEQATKRKLKSYPPVLEDVDTALSELRQIMAGSRTMNEVWQNYWCGASGSVNSSSYKQFAEAASKLWHALEPYAQARIKAENPERYKNDFSNPRGEFESSWGGLAYGDLEGYKSKLGAMPKLASQLRQFPAEKEYAAVARYYNKKLTEAEAIVIARAVLTFSDQTGGVVDPRLVMAVIKAESNFRPGAVSKAGALGLGQLMPATARGLGISDPFDPIQNIYGCVKYLEREAYRWRGNDNVLDLMLASYNAGAGAVKKYKGIPPYKETKNYVRIVRQHYKTYSGR